jgi:hypothetical protein
MQESTHGQIKDGIKPAGNTSQVEDEVIQRIRNEIDDCGDFCVDYAYEVDEDDAFEVCIDQCYKAISEEYNVPMEKIMEIVRSMLEEEEGYDE